ncbi:MAG: bifunctional 4-hydroxy-2-oxoglutarate aldolase/2-dehydro-3-deoxy-phosphogluconate aldolase [Thermoflexales bacterium]|nr:bifunctional 4-hydroxy-2-oxoglutarate aldolase/2-dehydro-3-deoxy-phosphogluconate aldolase [Thermoflexales bacterium]
MSRFSRLEVFRAVLETGLVPIFYHPDGETAREVVRACAAGGARVVEFTHRGDFALDVFRGLAHWARQEVPEVVLGVGSVVDAPTAALYLACGADFVVSPAFIREVARLCNRRQAAYIPGCGTVGEILRACEWGAEVVKLFPAQVLGPAFIRAVRGPCPWVRLLPTGGIRPAEAEVRAWLEAGAAAIGMGSELIRREWVEAGDWAAIAGTVREVLEWIRGFRRQNADGK